MPYLLRWNTPKNLLLALNTEFGRGSSVLNIGRRFYSCNNSIYGAIDWFSDRGLIEVTRLKRDLKIDFTEKGKEVLKAIWLLDGLESDMK